MADLPRDRTGWLPGLIGPVDLLLNGAETVNLRTTVDLVCVGATVADDEENEKTIVTIPAGGGGTSPTGTGVALVSGGAFVGAAGTVNLASGTYVSGTLPVANGGTGQTSGVVTFNAATQTLTNKTIDCANNTITNISDAEIVGPIDVVKLDPSGTNGHVLTTVAGVTAWAAAAGGSTPTGTGFRHVTSGTEDAASKLVVNADVDSMAAIAGTKISPDFGSALVRTSGNILSEGYFYTGTGNLASTGNIRMQNTHKICSRNAGNSADVCMMQYSSGDYLFVGLNSGFTEQAYIIVQAASNAQYFGIGSSYYWVVESAQLSAASPIVGYSSPFGCHGQCTSGQIDANYTVPASEYKFDAILFTFLCTAGRTMTFPHPASDAAGYSKTIVNTTTQTLTISTGTGTTKTLASGLGQRFRFSSAGVNYAGATYTP